MKKILIINRWADEFADYGRYIDHDQFEVSYLCNATGSIKVPVEKAYAIYEVEDLSDKQNCRYALDKHIEMFGKPDRIIALSEYDLDTAGYLREQCRIEGAWTKDVELVRNKSSMKRRMHELGIAAPRFLHGGSSQDWLKFALSTGFPLVAKPVDGAASEGVVVLHRYEELTSLVKEIDLDSYEIEEFVQGPIFHIDGLVQDSTFKFLSVSRYIGNCLDFRNGQPMGSVEVDNKDIHSSARSLCEDITKGLHLDNTAFHLELIFDSRRKRFVFLEIGARVGGGEIPAITKFKYGIDLVEEWVRIETGLPTNVDKTSPRQGVSGFAMIPKPSLHSYRFDGVDELRYQIPTIVNELTPARGQILGSGFDYEDIPGRFHYLGQTTGTVEKAIQDTFIGFNPQLSLLNSNKQARVRA